MEQGGPHKNNCKLKKTSVNAFAHPIQLDYFEKTFWYRDYLIKIDIDVSRENISGKMRRFCPRRL